MPSCSSQPSSAALRLAKAQMRWRRAADELLIDAIFDGLRVVRRDGDCTGRMMRQAALVPVMVPVMIPTMGPAQKTGARQVPAPVF